MPEKEMDEEAVRTQGHLDGARIRREQPRRDYIEVSHLCVDEMSKRPVPLNLLDAYQESFFEGYCAPQRTVRVTVRGIAIGREYIVGAHLVRGTWLEAEQWGRDCAGGDPTASIEIATDIESLLLPGIGWNPDGTQKNEIIS